MLLGGHNLAAMRDMASNETDAVIAAQLVDHADIASFGVVDTHPDDPDRVIGIRQRPDLLAPDRTCRSPLRTTVKLIDIFNDRYEPVGTEDKTLCPPATPPAPTPASSTARQP